MINGTKPKQELNENFFAQFNTTKKFKSGQVIIEPDNNLNSVYYLKSGFVRLYLISKEGKEITFNIHKPGNYFPMIWAITDIPNVYFFECLTEVTTLKAPREDVINFLLDNPDELYKLTKKVFSGMDGLTRLMDALLSNKSALHQVCSILITLAMRFGENRNKQILINLPITHRILGTLVGLSREATSRELEKLTKDKIITQKDHKILITNFSKLKEISTLESSEEFIY